MSRSEFGAKVRNAAWARCGGKCEGENCGLKLQVGKYQYDHIVPDGLGGKSTLENCAVLCSSCHSKKTHEHDRPIMTKADNQRKKHLGIKKAKRPFPKRKDPWGSEYKARMERG